MCTLLVNNWSLNRCKGYASSSKWGLIVSRGRNKNGTLIADVAISQSFSGAVISLPLALVYHCQVIIDDDTFFVVGGLTQSTSGRTASRKAYIYKRYRKVCIHKEWPA
jgi:hypothetical protein